MLHLHPCAATRCSVQTSLDDGRTLVTCGSSSHTERNPPDVRMLPLPQRRGKKLLVLDPKISAYLGFLTEIALLREHGVER
jgi:hypothetical protein